MFPNEKLPNVLQRPYSQHWLAAIEKALAAHASTSSSEQVAVYVVRRVCSELADFQEGIAPVDSGQHEIIGVNVYPEVKGVVTAIMAKHDVSWETLAALIQMSKRVRTNRS